MLALANKSTSVLHVACGAHFLAWLSSAREHGVDELAPLVLVRLGLTERRDDVQKCAEDASSLPGALS